MTGNWVALSDGVEIQFTQSGTPPEFSVGDAWEWRPIRRHGILKSLDGSRNTEYRSGTTPANSTIRAGYDLGSAQQPAFFVLDDHNIPATGTTTLYAHATTLFTESGGFSQVATWRPNRISELITSSAFRYWWWKVVMPASGQPAYLRYSGAFLGTGATLSKTPSPRMGISDDMTFLGSIDVTSATRGPHPRVNAAARPQYSWWHVRNDVASDGGKLEAAFDYAQSHSSYTMPPFWLILQDNDLSTVKYYSWSGNGLQRKYAIGDKWDYSVDWTSVIRMVAS